MPRRYGWVLAIALVLVWGGPRLGGQNEAPRPRRNVIIFVADGLRHNSVDEHDMPTLAALRADGVDFRNSYSVYPTFTMANAAAIATGHKPGDTGVFSNTIWDGYATFATGNFNRSPGTPTPFLENDQVLGDLDDRYGGNLLGEETLLASARAHGYNTATIGKLGPTTLQDVAAVSPAGRDFPTALDSIFIDDATGTSAGTPLAQNLRARIEKAGLAPEAPTRSNGYGATSAYNNGFSGSSTRAGTLLPNVVQQQWFADVATRVVLPLFEADSGKPFVLLFWSRDPDGTQHNQGDSLGMLFPGINGPTSHLALRNADRNLKQLLGWLDEHPAIKANTDVLVTSDHGFATIGRRELDRTGKTSTAESAQHAYLDANGNVDAKRGTLPTGFLAIDLAADLHMNLFDPGRRVVDGGRAPFRRVRLTSDTWEHPASGNGLIGADVEKLDGSDARVIVAANGGSDLVYVPDGNPEMVRTVVDRVLGYDYVGAVFLDDKFGLVPGTLPLSAIGLVGRTALPRPTLVVSFKVFYLNPDDLQTAIQVSDTVFQEGQGYHGGFGREQTYNTMAAIGPDFKEHFVDTAPVGNADIAPTLAHILGFERPAKGSLVGRVAREALRGGPDAPAAKMSSWASPAFARGQTVLFYQELDGQRYAEAACLLPRGPQADSVAACRR